MATAQPLAVPRRSPPAVRLATLAAVSLALLAVALVAGVILARHPPTFTVVFAVGIGLLGTLMLALARYNAAVALGVFLLAAVRVEPAPADLVFAVVIAVALATGRFRVRRVQLAVTILVGLFLALNLLASIEVIDATRAMLFFSITLYLGVFALWLSDYVRSVPRARLVAVAYISAAVASAALGTLALFVPFPGSQLFVTGPRAQGLFKDPNVFGAFLVPAALLLMEEAAAPRLLRLRSITKLVLLSILTIGILFSFSRAAWLNFAIAVVVMFGVLALRRGGWRRAMVVLGTALAAATALFIAVAVSSSFTFLQERARFQFYDVQRFGAQLSGVELAAEYPLGIGPGQFERVSAVSAHSTYVRALAEEGLLGLLVLLALVVLTLFFAAQNTAAGRDTFGIGSATLLAAWCGLLANSIFIDTLHWRHLWLIAALVWAGTMRAAVPRARWGRAPASPGGTRSRSRRPGRRRR